MTGTKGTRALGRKRLSSQARWNVAVGGGALAVIALVLAVLAVVPSQPSSTVASGSRTENTSGQIAGRAGSASKGSTPTPTDSAFTPVTDPDALEVPLSEEPLASAAPVDALPTTSPTPTASQPPAAPRTSAPAAPVAAAGPSTTAPVLVPDTAVTFPASPKPYLFSNDQFRTGAASESTWELWFATTTPGGMLAELSDKQTGDSTRQGRMLEIMDDGTLRYNLKDAQIRTRSPYTDGRWHHVVASVGPAGMKLYVDGGLVAADASVTTGELNVGWLRFGGDQGSYFSGSLDEVAAYPAQLTDDQVVRHHAAGAGALEAYSAAVLADHPWSLWHLSESSTGDAVTLADASGAGHTGRARGLPAGSGGAAGAIGAPGVAA